MQFGVDYVQSGVQSASLLKIILLEGKKPSETEFISPSSKIYINSKELEKFKIITRIFKKFYYFIMKFTINSCHVKQK